MTILTLDSALPQFSDVESHQPYDEPSGRAEALDRLKESYLAELGEGDPTSQAIAEASTKARALAADLTAALDDLVAAIMPPELATENSDYVVEETDRTQVFLTGQIARLQSQAPGKDPETTVQFRVSNTALEQNLQALLDHLTASRIAEEMDAPTYVERLRGAFKRARDGARMQSGKMEEHFRRSDIVSGRLSAVETIVGFLRADVMPRLGAIGEKENPDAADLRGDLRALEVYASNASALGEHFRKFLRLSLDSLTRIRRDFASDANMAGAEGESILVSREMELHPFYRPRPLLWALAITLLVKIVLAHNTSETLHFLAIPILFLSFALTWLLSIFIGVWARKRRMKDLQEHIRGQLFNILHAGAPSGELVEFPPIRADHKEEPPTPIRAFAYHGNAEMHKRRVVVRNLLALLIPAVLALAVVITREDVDHDFVAHFPGAEPCVLASGRMVFASPASYFVKSGDRVDTVGEWVLSRVFPELMADVVQRSRIITVRTAHDPAEEPLSDCVFIDPVGGNLTVIHEGNAFGDFDAEFAVTAIAEQTQSLIAALGNPRPINLDLGDMGEGGAPVVTVNLGDTSLDVLTQAILSGTTMPPGPVDPVIIDARTRIELELSKSEPNEIDLTQILDALNIIRVRLGEDASIVQALNVIFGGPTITTPGIELPDSVLLFLGGEDGETGLPAELRELRIALQASNELAAAFAATIATGGDGDTVVTVLNEQLTSIIEGQEQLIAALTANLAVRAQDAIVVTPLILDVDGGGGDVGSGGDGGVSANIFQTTIELAGTGTRLDTLANTLVLPFFPAPVQNGSGELATPQGAFDWGADLARLLDPTVDDDETTYFGRIAQTLESCLIGNATVELDIIGLASPSWDGATGATTAETLNYHLAEGRRVGALRRLAALMDEADRGRVLVQLSDGTTLTLPEIIDLATAGSPVSEVLARFARFGSSDEFEERRDTLLAVTGLNPDVESPLEELFGRSVVLRVVRSDGGPCQF
jgi:hypothetical protein